jgi:hypothetical protein
MQGLRREAARPSADTGRNASSGPEADSWRRFVTRERFLRVLKTLIAILLALAAVYSLQGLL